MLYVHVQDEGYSDLLTETVSRIKGVLEKLIRVNLPEHTGGTVTSKKSGFLPSKRDNGNLIYSSH